MPKVVEAKIVNPRSLDGSVVGFLHRFGGDRENTAVEGPRECLKCYDGTRGERNVAARAIFRIDKPSNSTSEVNVRPSEVHYLAKPHARL